jgi:multidrug efflux pump subunit AcrA (membrane-fusion protein)
MSDDLNNRKKEDLLKKPRLRWLKRLVVIGLVVLLIVGLWRFFTPEELVSVYQLGQVSEQDMTETLSLSGTVSPSKTQEIPYQNIPVQRILVQPGDRVQKGDRLLLYDLTTLRVDLNDLEESRDEAVLALEKSQEEAIDLMAGMEGLSMNELSAQLATMTGDLTSGLGQLANGMLSIGNPFQQLVNQFSAVDLAELNRLVDLMEDLNARGEELLEVLTDPEVQEDLQTSLEELEARLQELQEDLDNLLDQLPLPEEGETLPTIPGTDPTQADTDGGSTTTDPTTATVPEMTPQAAQKDDSQAFLALAAAPAMPEQVNLLALTSTTATPEVDFTLLSNGGLDLSQQDLLILMQQLQSVPGGSDLLDTYSQGAELMAMLDNQIKNLEESIETASKHEVANFDALVSQAQRDLDDLNSNQPLIELYDETEPLVHSRVNRRDALLLETGQAVTYTTDNLQLQGELVFKSPIATTTPAYSSGQTSDALSQLMGGDQSFLTSEPRVDIELTIEGLDLDKIIFGFDISYEVEIEKRENVLAVPSESLIAERGLNYVYVANDDNTFTLRPVETGIITHTYAELLSGLEAGDWVLLNPPSSIQEGVRYNVERQGE